MINLFSLTVVTKNVLASPFSGLL